MEKKKRIPSGYQTENSINSDSSDESYTAIPESCNTYIELIKDNYSEAIHSFHRKFFC